MARRGSSIRPRSARLSTFDGPACPMRCVSISTKKPASARLNTSRRTAGHPFLIGRPGAPSCGPLEVHVIPSLTDAGLPRHDVIVGAHVVRVGRARPRASARKWTIVPRIAAELRRRRASYGVICVIDYRGVGLPALFVGHRNGCRVAIQAQTEGVLPGSHPSALARGL